MANSPTRIDAPPPASEPDAWANELWANELWANEFWADLRQLTAARIGLERSGAALATAPLLELRLAHARARDAVHAPLDVARLQAALESLDMAVLSVASAAPDRPQYLMRPDLGRQLGPQAEAVLTPQAGHGHDLALVITDGLSARAVAAHAPPVLAELLPLLRADGWRMAPLVILRQGRVATADRIAQALRAACVVNLIGERPGLSAPDSMGAYLTWRPGPETTDANRNCISNIRPEGIDPAQAAFKIAHLLRAMRTHQLSGVALKDTSDRLVIDPARGSNRLGSG